MRDIFVYSVELADNGILVSDDFVCSTNVYESKEGEAIKDCYARAFKKEIAESIGAVIAAVHEDSPGKTEFNIKIEIK